jgi:Asp-tRNA(Asn)/Glu-tRNA(Gln) amidotransferase A subunit family amidase
VSKRSIANPLNMLGIKDIAAGLKAGAFQAEDVLDACFDRIEERDVELQAWVEVSRERARKGAGLHNAAGGALTGVPVGVKDVIDAAGWATRMGSSLYEENRPLYDAGCVGVLRMAGAVVAGKTSTCEFAGIQPAKTLNPHRLSHTPGGSSSGSAAAVADFMVPLALGTQTGGSVLRPASFCGIVGFKPTYGFYPVSGMKPAAHSFDTLGLFTRSVADVALVHSVLVNEEEADTAVRPPRVGIFRTHLWDTVGASAADNFESTVRSLVNQGAVVVEVEAPFGFERITEKRAVINAFERARDFAGEWLGGNQDMGALTRGISERGFHISGGDYAAARRDVEQFRASAMGMFADVDVIVTPVTPGEAPAGTESTGDPRLQELWTMLHMPSLSIPSGKGESGLPLGLQIVGQRFDDRAMLGWALWVENVLAVGDSNTR